MPVRALRNTRKPIQTTPLRGKKSSKRPLPPALGKRKAQSNGNANGNTRSSKRSRVVTQLFQSPSPPATPKAPTKVPTKPPAPKTSKIVKVTPKKSISKLKSIKKAPLKAKDRAKEAIKVKDAKKKGAKPEKVPKISKKRGKEAPNPKPHLTQWTLDPTFNSDLPLTSISTLADSRLLLRAVLTGNQGLLESLCTTKVKSICTLYMPRSLVDGRTAVDFALLEGNVKAYKYLQDKKNHLEFGTRPDLLIREEGTGSGGRNYHMYGHALANVTIGRGGMEGNAALLKDSRHYQGSFSEDEDTSKMALRAGMSVDTIEKLIRKGHEAEDWSDFLTNIVDVLRGGHRHLAEILIEKALKFSGYGFNFLHGAALGKGPLPPFKAVSVVKKAHQENSRVTPLHCAAINPDPSILNSLLKIRPEYTLTDSDNWAVGHYAAACEGDGPLKLLISRGIPMDALNKEGNAPIHIATMLGRLENVKLLAKARVEVEEEEPEDEEDDRKKAKVTSPVDTPNKKGILPLHLAAQYGHVEVLQFLLGVVADKNKGTPAKEDKKTALMLASQQGHLECVKILVEDGVKVEVGDRRKRTALVHAVMNGQGHVVSWLLRYGANHLTSDSSGNTLVHYAAAYGWLFILKLLYEAGCPPNPPNAWKMTPLAIAFLKGHRGIVEVILEHKEADINAPINDTTGMTLLLQTCDSEPSDNTMTRIKFLLSKSDIEPIKTDYEGNNALHFLVQREVQLLGKITTYAAREYYKTELEQCQKNQKTLIALVRLLMDRGCSPLHKNKNKSTPIATAAKGGCYDLLNIFIDSGIPIEGNEDGDTILHEISRDILKPGASTFYKALAKSPENLKSLRQMGNAFNNKGENPLHAFLRAFTESYEPKLLDQLKGFLNFLLGKLGLDPNLQVQEEPNKGPGDFPLHLAVAGSSEFLPILIGKVKEIDCVNWNGDTPLRAAIKNNNSNAIKILIKAGANVNFKMDPKDKSLLLLMADGRDLELFPLLVRSGADFREIDPKTGDAPIHRICAKPAVLNALACLKALIKAGDDVNAKNNLGRTPLHLCCSARGGETDVSYEIEELLIESGAYVTFKDARGRLPLHYVFAKIGRPLETTLIDPIELVALLTGIMRENRQLHLAGEADTYGSTCFHYAGMRGSTISASLLLSELTSNERVLEIEFLDMKDRNGNTPLGLAVNSGHDGIALFYYQKGAGFMGNLNRNIEKFEPTSENVDALSAMTGSLKKRDGIWEWDLPRMKAEEDSALARQAKIAPILQEVVQKNWQGLLYLMLDSLKQSGSGIGPAIEAAIKVSRFTLAAKLIDRARNDAELTLKEDYNLLHVLAQSGNLSAISHDNQLYGRILNGLMGRGVSPTDKDALGTTPIVYAIMDMKNQPAKYKLMQSLTQEMKYEEIVAISPDSFGRTPFSAYFWQVANPALTDSNVPSSWNAGFTFLDKLISHGGNPNVLTKYPIKITDFPCNRIHYSPSGVHLQEISPLSYVVLSGNLDVCKLLLSIKGIDVNFPDSTGKTPLMYAVLMNDVQMVKLLLNPKGYNIKTDSNNPWSNKSSCFGKKSNDSKVDLGARDINGWSVIHHVVAPFWPSKIVPEKSKEFFDFFSKISAPMRLKNKSGQTPLDLAREIGNAQLVKQLQSGQDMDIELNPDNFPIIKDGAIKSVQVDYLKDSKLMSDQLLKDAPEDEMEDPLDPKNSHLGSDKLRLVLDPTNQRPFDALLTQIELTYGVFGINNFYRIQLVEEPGKELHYLFTQWGRLGEDGQWQKTPYPSKEQAILEFSKVFKAKSGNSWQDYESFTPQTKKYRLMKSGGATTKKKLLKIPIDFDQLGKHSKDALSRLPWPMRRLMSALTFLHKNSLNSSNEDPWNEFTIVEEGTLELADSLLDQISKIVKSIEGKKITRWSVLDKKEEVDEYLANVERITELSTQFYSIVPIHGYSKERIKPLDNSNDLRPLQKKLYDLLHVDYAHRLLLAALYRCSTGIFNPLDYVYGALGTKLEPLERDSEEAQLLLQYSGSKVKVQRIFRVERAEEESRERALGLGDNKWLLFHGTKGANVLSILHRGLQVCPVSSGISGDLFGKGIYFADIFDKSKGYCDSEPSEDKSSFMLVAQVTLGKVHGVKLSHWANEETQNRLIPGANSLKTVDSRIIPDPSGTIQYKGVKVPLGKPIENKLPTDEHHGLNYNEYIVPDPGQTVLRYLIQFRND